MMLGWMASLGLPLLAGFVAEIAIMIAFWMTFGWLVIWPALTLIITAVYYLTSMQRTISRAEILTLVYFLTQCTEKNLEILHGTRERWNVCIGAL